MKINIIPVVFITNECIHQLDSTQVPALAKKITSLLKGMLSVDHITAVSQLQIDCDWSYPTRKNYFVLLKQIRSNTATIAASISCTIRLHQVKYLSGSGIPPVDRGLLMCYNMGDMEDPTATNSIIQATEINKYIGNLRSYPLQLDVALPLFEWGVLFRDNKYKGLVEDLHILNTSAFEEMNDHMHFLIRDTVINGVQYKKNDIIRTERSDYNEIMKTAGLINERLRTQNLHLALFHLDSVILNKYPTNELENIYSSLR